MKMSERNFARIAIIALLCFLSVGTLRSQFASQGTYMGAGSGSANAQTASLSNISSLADVVGVPITYIAPATNTGPTTFNLSSLGGVAINRTVPAGLSTLAGGEIVSGQLVTLIYDGTRFQLQNSSRPEPPGAIMDYGGSSCPTGMFSATSQTVAQATYPALFAVLGTNWGTSSGNIVTPDLRGRATFGIDVSVGSFANRITTAGGNFDGSVFANTGGNQNQTLLTTQIPAHSHTITDPGHDHPFTFSTFPFQVSNAAAVNNIAATGLPSTARTASNITGITGTNNAGGGLSHPILAPAAIVQKCVRA